MVIVECRADVVQEPVADRQRGAGRDVGGQGQIEFAAGIEHEKEGGAVEGRVHGGASAPEFQGQAGEQGAGIIRLIGGIGRKPDGAAGEIEADIGKGLHGAGAENHVGAASERFAVPGGPGAAAGEFGGAGEGAEAAAGGRHVKDRRLDVEGVEDQLVGQAGIAGDGGEDMIGVFADGRGEGAVVHGFHRRQQQPVLPRRGVEQDVAVHEPPGASADDRNGQGGRGDEVHSGGAVGVDAVGELVAGAGGVAVEES